MTNLDRLEESSIDDYWNVEKPQNSLGCLDRIHTIPNSQETPTKNPQVGKMKTDQTPANIEA